MKEEIIKLLSNWILAEVHVQTTAETSKDEDSRSSRARAQKRIKALREVRQVIEDL